MCKQEVHNQNLDKVHALITNQGEWVAKSRQDKFVEELYGDYCNVGLHALTAMLWPPSIW
jgi:hypothetical protein